MHLCHVGTVWASCPMFLLSGSIPGASEASPSKKPRSRGLLHSLFCCLCHKESEPPPLKNNAPLLVEENGTLSKVSSSLNIPLSCVINFLSPSLFIVFEQHGVSMIESRVMCETRVFLAQSFFVYKNISPGLGSKVRQCWWALHVQTSIKMTGRHKKGGNGVNV